MSFAFFEVLYKKSALKIWSPERMCLLLMIGQSPTFLSGQGTHYCCSALLWLYQIERVHFLGHPVTRKATKQQTDNATATAAMIPILGTHKVFEFLILPLPCAQFSNTCRCWYCNTVNSDTAINISFKRDTKLSLTAEILRCDKERWNFWTNAT